MNSEILVVEDEAVTQRLLQANLERAGHRVRCVGSVQEAEAAIRELLPDMVLLDWVLPDVTGLTLIRRLRADQRTRDVPVIMLSSRWRECDKVTGLEVGADDYLTKPFSPLELLARVKTVMRRRAPQRTDDVVEASGIRIDPGANRITAGGHDVELGAIEFRMLHFFVTHPNRVFSRTQLLNEVWGDHVFVEERTVDVHIRGLRRALTPSGHDSLLETVRGTGYSFRHTAHAAPPASAGKAGAPGPVQLQA
ncbi:MAG: phosphate regulon transcriptional regulator PhoB [Bacteroidota bacterium]